MNKRNRKVWLPLIVCVFTVIGGCFGTSPSSRFYTLSQRESRGSSADRVLDVLVKIGPVSIPSYIDRRQIVTRNGQNMLEIGEFERWGGSLDDEIIWLLVNDLSERLATRKVIVVPWRSIALADAPKVYRIPFSIDRFDGELGGTVVLKASWGLVLKDGKQEKVLVARESTIHEAVGGKGYDALVAAMGKAVGRLGEEMADVILAAGGGEKPK